MDDFNEITADKSKDYLVSPWVLVCLCQMADDLAPVALDEKTQLCDDHPWYQTKSPGLDQPNFDVSPRFGITKSKTGLMADSVQVLTQEAYNM